MPRDGLDRDHFPRIASAAMFEERTKRYSRLAQAERIRVSHKSSEQRKPSFANGPHRLVASGYSLLR